MNKRVRVRFAPSPTGYLHIGGLRSALYNYLFARHHGGDFILRIEDTDRTRYVADGVQNILESLTWVGLTVDEGPYLAGDGSIREKGSAGPYTQSARLEIYKAEAEKLLSSGKAYICFCSAERLDEVRKAQEAMKVPPMYDRHCRAIPRDEALKRRADGEACVVRMAVPVDREIVFEDMIRGRISFQSNTVDDQVLMKSDGYPTYHLANIVDDHAMGITHVIRGEEWLTSTPKHLMLYEMFGYEAPTYAHLPLLLNPDRSKLSKRQGDVAALDYKKNGYLPDAIVNFLALLGWNPSDKQEIYKLEELIPLFEISKVGKSGAVFNREKLDWLNGHYLRTRSADSIKQELKPFIDEQVFNNFANSASAILAATERASTLTEVANSLKELASGAEYDGALLVWKKSTKEKALEVFTKIVPFLRELSEPWKAEALEAIMKEWITKEGLSNGDVLWPIRVALSGLEKSAPPFVLLQILGKTESLKRLEKAKDLLARG